MAKSCRSVGKNKKNGKNIFVLLVFVIRNTHTNYFFGIIFLKNIKHKEKEKHNFINFGNSIPRKKKVFGTKKKRKKRAHTNFIKTRDRKKRYRKKEAKHFLYYFKTTNVSFFNY